MRTLRFPGSSTVAVAVADDPSPGHGEVVVETVMSAICGSEMHAYRDAGQPGNPGHEAAGVVAAVGAGVAGLRVGDRVGVSAVAGCGACAECAAGRFTWCDRHRVYTDMHAERFRVAAASCHVLPDDVPWDVGVLLTGDGLGVPYHTYLKTRSSAIRTIAVVGLGPIGLGSVLVQAHAGRRVIGIDLSPYRLEHARRLGAAESLVADATVAERVRALTGGDGVDAVIEAGGRRATVALALSIVKRGGQVFCNGELDEECISPSRDLIRRDITVTGSWFYHFNEFPSMLALWRDGLDVAALTTHRYALADAPAAYAAFAGGVTGKVMLEMRAQPA